MSVTRPKKMQISGMGVSTLCLIFAVLLVFIARLIDVPAAPVVRSYEFTTDPAVNDIFPSFAYIIIGGLALLGCHIALAAARTRWLSVVLASVFGLVFAASVLWLSLALVGDAYVVVLNRGFTLTTTSPVNRLNDAAQMPLVLAALALLVPSTVAIAHLLQTRLPRKNRTRTPFKYVGWR